MVACAKITNCLMDGKTAAEFLAEINSTLAELRQKMDIIEEQLSCLLSRIEEEPESETLVSQMETPEVEKVPGATEDIPEVEETPEVAEDIPEVEEAPAATEDIPEVEEVPAAIEDIPEVEETSEVAEDIAENDLQTEDIPVAMEDIPEIDDLPEEEDAPIMEAPVAADETPIDIDIVLPSASEKIESTAGEEVRVSINEAGERKLAKSVGDAASEKPRWRIDRPGSPVRNIISAISLNDRVLFIKTLFGEDPLVFQESISALNSMSTMEEAEAYIGDRFPDWKMSSDVVYRFMMAVRRKLG